MAGMTTLTATGLLAGTTSQGTFTNVTTSYLAMFTAVGSDAGTGFTEAAYTSYAREATPAATWNAPSGTSPTSITNSGSVAFPVCANSGTAVVETEIAFGLLNNPTAAVSGTTLLMWDYLGAYSWNPFTCTSALPGVMTVPAHGYSNGDQVVVDAEYGGTLPTTGGSWAGLLTVANVTTDTFTVGVNTTSTGNGMIRKVQQQAIVPNVQPIFNAGSIVINAA